jgi:micrococcal nuclease
MPRRSLTRNAVLALFVVAACDSGSAPSPTPADPPDRDELSIRARVLRVVDGDTIRVDLEGMEERVRYIGVDTPEQDRPFCREATRANAALVEDETVELRFDVERRDRYGRLLAYVHLSDGSMVNARLVELGFAQVMTVPPNVHHQARFLVLEREARAAGRGLWAAD